MYNLIKNTNVKVNALIGVFTHLFGQNNQLHNGLCFAKNPLLPQTSMTHFFVSPKVNQNDSKTDWGFKSQKFFLNT